MGLYFCTKKGCDQRLKFTDKSGVETICMTCQKSFYTSFEQPNPNHIIIVGVILLGITFTASIIFLHEPKKTGPQPPIDTTTITPPIDTTTITPPIDTNTVVPVSISKELVKLMQNNYSTNPELLREAFVKIHDSSVRSSIAKRIATKISKDLKDWKINATIIEDVAGNSISQKNYNLKEFTTLIRGDRNIKTIKSIKINSIDNQAIQITLKRIN